MKIVIAILIFGLIVLIHELGHFIFARINGIEVVDFSIGMGPRLCGFRAFGTQFSIRLFPIGGACMMLGEDQDQNMDSDKSFYSKNVWQRISVLFAGPGFNFILAFLFSMIIIGMDGFDPAKVTGVTPEGPAAEAGMLAGDVITKIEGSRITLGKEVDSYFYYHTITEEPVHITVKRNGEKVKLTLVPEAYDKYMLGLEYDSSSAKIITVSENSPLEKAGLKKDDVIVQIGGETIENGADLSNYLGNNPLTDREIELTYKRNGEETTVSVVPEYAYSGYTLGFSYNLAGEDANAWETLRYSVAEVKYWIAETGRGLAKLFTGKLKSNEIGSVLAMGDFIGDAYSASKEYGARITILSLLRITVFLSANIGVMNLLPIPALDGGKLLFCAIEVIRRKPVDREKEGMVHFIGLVLLLILMVFLIFNDVKNIFFTK